MAMRSSLLLLAVLAGVVGHAAGLTFIPMEDEELANRCTLVVRATVTAAPNATFRYGVTQPVTRSAVRILEVLRANKEVQVVAGQSAVVTVMGGYDPASDILVNYPGAPELVTGVEYILFADLVESNPQAPIEDVENKLVLVVHQFALGAFRRISDPQTGAVVALCDGIDHVASPSRTRHFEKFASWIKDSKMNSAGRLPASQQRKTTLADYWLSVAPAAIQPAARSHSKREWFNGYPRFCEFDSGQEVKWYSLVGGQPSKPNGYVEYFTNAVNIYNDLGRQGKANIITSYGGTTTSTNGLTTRDNIYSIIYDDPNNFITGSFSNCAGVLGVGGSTSSGSCLFRGISMRKIISADIVIQDGVETCASLSAKDFEELYGHELGHSFGMAHTTSVSEALMYPSLHGDNRGAVFDAYDISTLQFLYCATYPNCDGTPTTTSSGSVSSSSSSGSVSGSGCLYQGIDATPNCVGLFPDDKGSFMDASDRDAFAAAAKEFSWESHFGAFLSNSNPPLTTFSAPAQCKTAYAAYHCLSGSGVGSICQDGKEFKTCGNRLCEAAQAACNVASYCAAQGIVADDPFCYSGDFDSNKVGGASTFTASATVLAFAVLAQVLFW